MSFSVKHILWPVNEKSHHSLNAWKGKLTFLTRETPIKQNKVWAYAVVYHYWMSFDYYKDVISAHKECTALQYFPLKELWFWQGHIHPTITSKAKWHTSKISVHKYGECNLHINCKPKNKYSVCVTPKTSFVSYNVEKTKAFDIWMLRYMKHIHELKSRNLL